LLHVSASKMTSLLFEIGVEELPASYVDAALRALPDLLLPLLAEARLSHEGLRLFGTPRRLAVLVTGLPETIAASTALVIGPPESAAYKDGEPTRAATAFAEKCGVAVTELTCVDKAAEGKQKAGRFVVATRTLAAQNVETVLPALLATVAGKIPFRKSMRWGSGESTASFGRPVQWLLCLLGSVPVPVTFAGLIASNKTRGHRFLSPEEFTLDHADHYEAALAARHVVASLETRKTLMMQRVNDAAKAAGGTADQAEILISENATLVESPLVVTGTYDRKFLSLPPAVIRAVARGHQRYFCVETQGDALLPSYVAVVNTAANPSTITKGMNRVMTARLSDAQFFFEEDKKNDVSVRREKLRGLVFHNKLGSVYDKTERLVTLADHLAEALQLSTSERAETLEVARDCKADLTSLMVGEFPELQGQMGRAYALHAGSSAGVADGIRDHYKPLGASDALAQTDVARIVALADRLDTLMGCFAVGLEPTGASDPFALRRNCIALLRMLTEDGASGKYAALNLRSLLEFAYEGFAAGKLELLKADAVSKVLAFAEERLRGILASATSDNAAAFVLGGLSEHALFPSQTLERSRGFFQVLSRGEPWIDRAKTVTKRLSGIGKEAKPVMHEALSAAKPEDQEILRVVRKVDEATQKLRTATETEAALREAEALALALDGIFERTLVNDPQDPFTPKRLEVLSYGASCMLRLGDFSKLSSQ
jgi:glycyl-tRNA synthetase beta chain